MLGEKKWLVLGVALATAAGCNDSKADANGDGNAPPDDSVSVEGVTGEDGPADGATNPNEHAVGDATRGKDVFRFATFGNEGFWTDAAKLPAGIVEAKLTPVQALQAGLSVDVEALDAATQAAVAAELASQGTAGPILNDPATTLKLISANAVIGVVTVDTNKDGKLDVTNGDKVGVSCALCHTITDASVANVPTGGSVGKGLDGRAPHTINVGGIFALAKNSRALYPLAQLALTANGGKTIGRAPTGLTETSSEAETDAYFGNPAFYPVGMFDDAPDGTGAPMHNAPLFRTDLAAPWGSEGTISKLDNFSNLVYTALLDPTTLITPSGRAFLKTLGGTAGEEISNDYFWVLNDTGVTPPPGGFPYIEGAIKTEPGTEAGPVGIRVDNQKLLDMNAYLNGLAAPEGAVVDAAVVGRGRDLFRTNCTTCHNVDQSRFVPPDVRPMKVVWPGDNPVQLAVRAPPLNPVLNTVDNIFDDKMVVVNASIRGLERGLVMPLLLDLDRKPVFLHDNSVPSLDILLDPARGPTAPHPFYLADSAQRGDMVGFLKSLDTTN